MGRCENAGSMKWCCEKGARRISELSATTIAKGVGFTGNWTSKVYRDYLSITFQVKDTMLTGRP